jgi:hypothetical protein
MNDYSLPIDNLLRKVIGFHFFQPPDAPEGALLANSPMLRYKGDKSRPDEVSYVFNPGAMPRTYGAPQYTNRESFPLITASLESCGAVFQTEGRDNTGLYYQGSKNPTLHFSVPLSYETVGKLSARLKCLVEEKTKKYIEGNDPQKATALVTTFLGAETASSKKLLEDLGLSPTAKEPGKKGR